MTDKRLLASGDTSPQAGDDFTRIKGIGIGRGNRLHRCGIHTYAQFSALPPETIAALLPNLSAEQVIKKKWIDESAKLASRASATKTSVSQASLMEDRQHYENFTFEFLMDWKNKVRRIQVVHVQSGDVDTWSKWDPERLIDFLTRHAGAHLSYSKHVAPAVLKELPLHPVVGTNGVALPGQSEKQCASPLLAEISELPPQIHAPDARTPSKAELQHLRSPVASTTPINKIYLLEWKILLENTSQPVHHLTHDQAFDVKLTFDLTQTSLAENSQLDFTAYLYAKQLGGGLHEAIAETKQTLPFANTVELTISRVTLPQGLYRLEALLTLVDPVSPNRARINNTFQGGLVQVY